MVRIAPALVLQFEMSTGSHIRYAETGSASTFATADACAYFAIAAESLERIATQYRTPTKPPEREKMQPAAREADVPGPCPYASATPEAKTAVAMASA